MPCGNEWRDYWKNTGGNDLGIFVPGRNRQSSPLPFDNFGPPAPADDQEHQPATPLVTRLSVMALPFLGLGQH
jgi:hypothetical protein